MTSYVQFGCLYCAPDGWTNFDSSPTLRLERLPVVGHLMRKNERRFPANVRYGDIVKGLPIPSNSARAIYASHVLEHLSRVEFELALRNTFEALEPGGVFRLVVPDLEIRAKRYLESLEAASEMANDWFMRATLLGEEKRRTLPARLIKVLGGSQHQWMWDYPSLRRSLDEHGFVSIRRARLGDNPDPMFDRVEDPNRFFDPVDQLEELCVEGIKPGPGIAHTATGR
jgi:SAM-dependent methyltransferase